VKNKLILITSIVLLLVLSFFSHKAIVQSSDKEAKIQNSRMTPIIFVPGSSATINRFDDLFKELNATGPVHSILKVQVNENNQLVFHGKHTVFGQVIEGMDVVDKIAGVAVDMYDKPREDVKIEMIEIAD